jgi:hypothetical protein
LAPGAGTGNFSNISWISGTSISQYWNRNQLIHVTCLHSAQEFQSNSIVMYHAKWGCLSQAITNSKQFGYVSHHFHCDFYLCTSTYAQCFLPPGTKMLIVGCSRKGKGWLISWQTNKLNKPIPWSRVLLEKLIVTQLVQFCTLYRNWSFITVLTRTRQQSLSWAKKKQSILSHPNYLWQKFSMCLIKQYPMKTKGSGGIAFGTDLLCISNISHPSYMPCTSHIIINNYPYF